MKVQSCRGTWASIRVPSRAGCTAYPAEEAVDGTEKQKKIPSSNLKQPILEVTAAQKQRPAGPVWGGKAKKSEVLEG